MNKLGVRPFFDKGTHTVTYVVTDNASKHAAVIDPVLNFNASTGGLCSCSADKIIEYLDDNNLQLEWILETHAHSDHLTASKYLKEKRGGQIGIGEHIKKVQSTFKKTFNYNSEMPCDGSQFDQLFEDGEVIYLGHIAIEIMHTPGHTPACVSYKFEDTIFVGDTLFMPDYGTARADFPNGSARSLYQSIQRILSLPNSTRMFVGHDYKTNTKRNYAWETSVLQQKRNNIHLKDGMTEQAFIKLRNAKDATLEVPKLLMSAMQVNIRAGCLPEKEDNGVSYLKMPLVLELS